MTENGTLRNSPPKISVFVKKGDTSQQEFSFTESFSIGRDEECEIQVRDSSVSRIHAEVYFSEGRWWIRDLNSANGTLVDGKKIDRLPLVRSTRIELGAEGPMLDFEINEVTGSITIPAKKDPSVTQYVKQYFSDSSGKDAGEHTMYLRKAFARVQKKQRGKYFIIIGATAILLLIAATVVVVQHTKLQKQEQYAIDLFYEMKSLELEIAKLKERVNVRESVSRLAKMNENYDRFIDNLGLYKRKMSQEDRLIMKMASIFGECEVNIPDKLFVQEVKKYIKKWQSTEKFAAAIKTARQNRYTERIYRTMRSHNLPPQFFYLALQESSFETDACGPQTRYGYAKGMWQFIPDTGRQFGLRIGPLAQYRRPDPEDERHDFAKSTKAAAEYIRSIYNTRAQASGLLVMASYNWGERRVIRLIDQMPDNPRDRNFWRLLEDHVDRIPKQTYDYVFRIFSAAVIGENPRYFGFEFSNPLEEVQISTSR
ncbi:MAG: FHA domain-containing protein [Candidatus Aminicenantes bacterium]|jgi:hypothetical protein